MDPRLSPPPNTQESSESQLRPRQEQLEETIEHLVDRARADEPDLTAEIYPPPLQLGASASVDCSYWAADYRRRLHEQWHPPLVTPPKPVRDHMDDGAQERFDNMVLTTRLALRGRS
jgi:hypothetical protein